MIKDLEHTNVVRVFGYTTPNASAVPVMYLTTTVIDYLPADNRYFSVRLLQMKCLQY